MFTQQQAQTLKRGCSHFEIESPFPDTIKRKRFTSDTNNNNNNTITTTNTTTTIDNNNDFNRPISPTSFMDDENKLYHLKQHLLEQQQWRYQNTNNTNVDNGGSSGTMTPMSSSSQSQIEYTNHTTSTFDNTEPYYEIEEYMSNGYEIMQNNNMKNLPQYGLYDMTQEEVEMMIMDDTTLATINTTY